MAVQRGLVKLEGSLGNITYYRLNGQWVARMRAGPSAEKIARGKNYARTRENIKEFGAVSRDAKLFRMALECGARGISDSGFVNRVMQFFHKTMQLDTASKRGERKVHKGLKTPKASALAGQLQLNARKALENVFKSRCILDRVNRELVFGKILTDQEVVFPKGAIYAQVQLTAARIHFQSKRVETQVSHVLVLKKRKKLLNQTLTIPPFELKKGHDFYLLTVCFVQEVGGGEYALMNKGFQAGRLVE